MTTVMPLVREFNQVCQVFADNINLRYGYDLEPQTLIPEEVEIWAKQFNVPIPPQQAQAQPQADKKCASGVHQLVGQVGAGRYHSGHTLDPAKEEINRLQNVATKWE